MGLIPAFTDSQYAAGANAVGDNVLDDLKSIRTVVNGQIDADNVTAGSMTSTELAAGAVTVNELGTGAVVETKIDYGSGSDGPLVARVGPNYADTGGVRLARVSKSVTFGGTGSDSVTFTYSSDCVDGNPGFSGVPTLMGMPVVASVEAVGDVIDRANVTASSSTAITFTFTNTGTSSATVTIEFGIMGPVA